ncbi:hypothetical protein PMAYCL1PPCAC_27700, partial [Pristionchus mayeri]
YFVVIYAMYGGVRRVLNRSFKVIFTLTAVVNIATWLNAWLNMRLQRESAFFEYFEWLNEHQVLSDILAVLISQFYYAQNVCLLMLTLDRFAVIWSVTHNTMWWNKYYLPITFFLQLFCVALYLISRWPIHRVFYFDKEAGFYSFYYDKSINCNHERATSIQLCFGVVILFVCSVLNILSIWKLRRLRKTTSISKEIAFFLIC